MWSITSDELEVQRRKRCSLLLLLRHYYYAADKCQHGDENEARCWNESPPILQRSVKGSNTSTTCQRTCKHSCSVSQLLVDAGVLPGKDKAEFCLRTSALVSRPPSVYVLMLPRKQQTDRVACLHGNEAHWMKWVNKCTNATFTSARVTTEGSYLPLFCSFDDTKSRKILKWQVWPIFFHSRSIQNCIFSLHCVHLVFFAPLYVCRVWLAWC